MSSFDKIETAARAREVIKRIASSQVKSQVSGKLVGRMMSVDLPRLKGTVWFPGDSQPTPVDIFANAVPADWQYKEIGRPGEASSTEGHGAEVVVERLNGVLYVTQILSGGTSALDLKSLGMSTLAMKASPTSAGGPTADAAADIAGQPHETFMSMLIQESSLDIKEGVQFGPFTSFTERTPFKGTVEMTILLQDSFRTYRLVHDFQEDFDIESDTYPMPIWARLIPEQSHEARWYPGVSARLYGNEYALDVSYRKTAYGNDEAFKGYREMWFRIVKLGEWKDPGMSAWITLRSTSVQRGRSLGGRELFMKEKVHRPSFPYGYMGFHESGMGPTKWLSNHSDNFGRVVSGSWGQGDSIFYTTEWVNGVNASTRGVDGESGYVEIAANATEYEVNNNYNGHSSPDITFRVQCPVVATGANFRFAFIYAQDPSNSNNRMMLGLDFKLAGALDITSRQRISGTTSAISGTVGAGFTYSAGDWIKMRIRVEQNHFTSQTFRIKAWKDGTDVVEPLTWQKEFQFNPAAVWAIGYNGFYFVADAGNTNTKPVRMKVSELEGVAFFETWAGHGEWWYTGPWRSGKLRTAQDLQKTWTYEGQFRWDGTYLKLPTKIHFHGVGRNMDGLASGRAFCEMNLITPGETVLHYPFRKQSEGGDPYLAVTTSLGIPLDPGESLWCGIEPGTNYNNLFRYLFIMDSDKAWQGSIPEWAVLIASRGVETSVPQIRLGNGEHLDMWRTPTFSGTWSAYASGYDTPQYRLEAGGVVRLKGLIKNTTTSQTGTMFTLPVGFRPLADKIFIALSSAVGTSGATRINVTAAGNVDANVHFTGGGAGFLSLENVTFTVN